MKLSLVSHLGAECVTTLPPSPLSTPSPNRHVHTSPHSFRLERERWAGGEEVKGMGDLIPGWRPGVASQPTPSGPTFCSLGLDWSCRGCKLPHGLQCCFTSAEDLDHGICKCNTCRRLKHTHPGRRKHTSTEACPLPGTS